MRRTLAVLLAALPGANVHAAVSVLVCAFAFEDVVCKRASVAATVGLHQCAVAFALALLVLSCAQKMRIKNSLTLACNGMCCRDTWHL